METRAKKNLKNMNGKEKEFFQEFTEDYDALREGCQGSTFTDCQFCPFYRQKDCFKVKLAYCLYKLGYRKIGTKRDKRGQKDTKEDSK